MIEIGMAATLIWGLFAGFNVGKVMGERTTAQIEQEGDCCE